MGRDTNYVVVGAAVVASLIGGYFCAEQLPKMAEAARNAVEVAGNYGDAQTSMQSTANFINRGLETLVYSVPLLVSMAAGALLTKGEKNN